MSILALSVAIIAQGPFLPLRSAVAQSACTELTIDGIQAIGDDGNAPSNTIDNQLSTRWSHNGVGSWIQADLGEKKMVCSVDVAWYKGTTRVNDFAISVSNDGNSFTNVYSGKNSGTTLSSETYDFADVEARYVKITVNGNSDNEWASITEIDVSGYAAGSTDPVPVPTPTPEPDTDCTDLGIERVSAIGDDGNAPSNTIDNQLSTRWSHNGVGSWIIADLGAQEMICSVDIAWYKGNIRTSDFVISLSSDGSSFTNVHSGTSSGQTTSSETADFTDREARYVKITVNGNSDNEWASITEIDVSGYSTGATDPEPAPTPDPEPEPTTGVDKFGIKMLYPTKSGGEQWFLSSPTNDDRFDPKTTVTKNSDGSYRVTSDKVRMNVFTSTGYDQDEITTFNQKQMATKGYMQSSNDWRNVEMTGYVKFNSGSDDNFAWYARGGRHTDTDNGCEGTAYKGDLYYSGKTRFAKEQWHSGGYSFTSAKQATDSLKGEWVGFKFVMYNFEKDGKTAVKLEIWLDKDNNGNWVKVDEKVDSGSWGDEGGHCGGSADQIISWGGPIATFRWDSASSVDFKNLSVREIRAP